MKTLTPTSVSEAWKAFSTEEYGVGDRIEGIGIFGFNGRVKEISPAQNPSGLTLKIVTLADECFGGLGIQTVDIGSWGIDCTGWESVKKNDPKYQELLEYSQKRE